jgi:hypothetical protein
VVRQVKTDLRVSCGFVCLPAVRELLAFRSVSVETLSLSVLVEVGSSPVLSWEGVLRAVALVVQPVVRAVALVVQPVLRAVAVVVLQPVLDPEQEGRILHT